MAHAHTQSTFICTRAGVFHLPRSQDKLLDLLAQIRNERPQTEAHFVRSVRAEDYQGAVEHAQRLDLLDEIERKARDLLAAAQATAHKQWRGNSGAMLYLPGGSVGVAKFPH